MLEISKQLTFLVTALTLFSTIPAYAGLAERIEDAALNGEANVTERDGKRFLYGVHIDPTETEGGKWACARVTAAVLKRAGFTVPRKVPGGKGLALAVWEVETSVDHWPKITRESDLAPGDVVIYESILPWKPDECREGKGACHVGVWTRQGLFHNHPTRYRPHLYLL